MHRGRPCVLVTEQFLRNTDLLGREYTPRGGGRGPDVVRAQPKPEPPHGMARKYSLDCGVRQGLTLRIDPQRGAAGILVLELDASLCLLLADDDAARFLGEVEVSNQVDRCEVLAPQWVKSRQSDHQAVPVLNGIGQGELRPKIWPNFVHELLADAQKLQAGDRRSCLGLVRRHAVKPRFDIFEPT